MTQQIIITTPVNSGDGTPIANAFTYCNDNFSELYSRAQSTPPATYVGSPGDVAGMYAYDSAAWFYCFADYDGSSDIWAAIPENQQNSPRIINGNTQVNIANSSGNVVVSVNSSNVSTFTTAGQRVVGTVSVTGNVTTDSYFVGNFIGNISGNLVVPGLDTQVLYNQSGNAGASAGLTFNYTSNVLTTSGSITATGNVQGGNIESSGAIGATGAISASGNVRGANINTVGLMTATGNITGGNVRTSGQVSATGNVTGGNLLTVGAVSSLGNISAGQYLLGDGSLITNLPAGNYANSNVAAYLPTYSGNIAGDSISVFGNIIGANISTSGSFSVTGTVAGGNISTTGNVTGANVIATNTSYVTSATNNQAEIHLTDGVATSYIIGVGTGLNTWSGAGSLDFITSSSPGANIGFFPAQNESGRFTTAGLLVTGVMSATGNVTGANVLTGGFISATGNILGNVFSVNSGNTDTAIINAGGNGVGNIGSSSTYFNTVFATASAALYADLAECYLADADYAPGTVLCFDGTAEVTQCNTDACTAIAGVVSTRPAYQMNSGLTGDHVVSMALMGRVPCAVQGPIARGDMLVSAGNGRARAEKAPAMGTVIGKALESFTGNVGTIEIVVGRL